MAGKSSDTVRRPQLCAWGAKLAYPETMPAKMMDHEACGGDSAWKGKVRVHAHVVMVCDG